jgi:ABC-type multidrug transport system fused ATPase/permease subunit
LKNPEIILLDEPTSALDSFSEEKITEALDTLFKNRTVIIVAHRLQTVKKADDIIVIE